MYWLSPSQEKSEKHEKQVFRVINENTSSGHGAEGVHHFVLWETEAGTFFISISRCAWQHAIPIVKTETACWSLSISQYSNLSKTIIIQSPSAHHRIRRSPFRGSRTDKMQYSDAPHKCGVNQSIIVESVMKHY